MKENDIAPLYQQIREDIKGAIKKGIYAPQDKIPSELELSEEYNVSRITVRRAVEELCSEGYLVKRQGRGTFVSKPRMLRKFQGGKDVLSFTEHCKMLGMVSGSKLLERQIVPARIDEQEFLGLSADSLLIYIQRLRTADGEAIMLENDFLPYTEFKELMNTDLQDVSLFKKIEELSGRIPTNTVNPRTTIEMVRATGSPAQKLGVSLGEPLFYMNCHFRDQNDKPLFLGRQYMLGSRYMFTL